MASARAFRWALLALVAGCGERDRLIFPSENPGDGSGPTTEILHPAAPDTAVIEGDLLIVQGRTYDADGVATVFFEVGGTNQAFAPIQGQGADTVDFALQLSTLNHGGATVILRAYGVDLLGQQGSLVSRQIRIE
jgi:hypothetical protein